MRILQVATHKRVTRGGAIQMVRLARALQGRGHGVTLVFNKGSQEDEQAIAQLRKEGFPVAFFPMDGLNLQAMLSFRRFVVEGRFQVIHAHRDPALHFVFLSLMGLDVPLVAQKGTTYRPGRLIRWILKSPKVSRISTVAYAVKEVLVSSGIPPAKICVVYGSVDFQVFRPDVSGDAVRQEFQIPSNAPVVGMVAALVGKKGYPVFLGACNGLLEKLAHLHVLMVGAGRASKFSQEVASLGTRARFMGHREDVPRCMAAMDVVVCASTKGEGLTGALREAMAMAKPVVSSAVSGNAKVVLPGKTGILVTPGDVATLEDALLKLLAERASSMRLARGGRRLALRLFNDDARAHRMEALYKEVVR
jgi:glycosyltransferase involved in cell wall biosynthesis